MKLDINNYPGSKYASGSYQQIINRIPPHKTYIEPFVGSGAIFFKKKLAEFSLLTDSNEDVILQHVYSDAFNDYKDWSHNANQITTFRKDNNLVVLDACDYKECIENSWHYPERFIYLDPPYLKSTRKSEANIYAHEWTESDHITFLEYVKTLECNIMISCYDSFLYEIELDGWNKHSFKVMTRKGEATETIYFNYKVPSILHDYEYIGDDFTERQRINRKVTRQLNRLKEMHPLERNKLIAAIIDKYSYTQV